MELWLERLLSASFSFPNAHYSFFVHASTQSKELGGVWLDELYRLLGDHVKRGGNRYIFVMCSTLNKKPTNMEKDSLSLAPCHPPSTSPLPSAYLSDELFSNPGVASLAHLLRQEELGWEIVDFRIKLHACFVERGRKVSLWASGPLVASIPWRAVPSLLFVKPCD